MTYSDNTVIAMRKPDCAIDAVANAMRNFGDLGRGAHKTPLDASKMIRETRERTSESFNLGNPLQVVFTSSSTENLSTVTQGLFSKGGYVIITVLEHNFAFRPLYLTESRGVSLTILSCDERGILCYDQLEESMRPETKVVVCIHASNLTGSRMDLERVGKFCHGHGIRLMVDASWTAGVLPIDMKRVHIDMLRFIGHKGLLGPQGTGGVCVGDDICMRPLEIGGSGAHAYLEGHLRDMPTALEAGTLNDHGIAGLHAALSFIEETGVKATHRREVELMRRFYDGVVQIPGTRVYGDFTSDERAVIVALNIGDYDSSEASDELAAIYGVSTCPGVHCAPLIHESSKTVEQGIVWFSFSYFSTEEEIDIGTQAVRELMTEEWPGYII